MSFDRAYGNLMLLASARTAVGLTKWHFFYHALVCFHNLFFVRNLLKRVSLSIQQRLSSTSFLFTLLSGNFFWSIYYILHVLFEKKKLNLNTPSIILLI